jgi:uncharacterized protein with FMN-binding domain
MTARRAASGTIGVAFAVAVLAAVKPRPQDLPAQAASTAPPVKAPADRPRVSSRRPSRPGRVVTATSPYATTPFTVLAVRVTLTGRELTRVETVELAGTGARTQAINARAEPILREEALRAGSADIDVVSGATYTSRAYRRSLQAALDRAHAELRG